MSTNTVRAHCSQSISCGISAVFTLDSVLISSNLSASNCARVVIWIYLFILGRLMQDREAAGRIAPGVTYRIPRNPAHTQQRDNNYSWDDTGFERDRSTSFSDYLDRNFEYRSGTITEFDFGSLGNNRAVANEIERGPRNAKFLHIFPSGYNLISNNCGETLCRIAERFELPKNNSIAPWSHQNYINNNMSSFIRVQSRQVPPAYRPRFSVPPIRPIPRPRPTPVQ